jgi:hypothetical protein
VPEYWSTEKDGSEYRVNGSRVIVFSSPCVELQWPEQRTAEQQNIEPQNFEGFFTSTFDIHCSIFDILF